MKDWKFTIEYVDWPVNGPASWLPSRVNDFYLNGYFIGCWFIGWMR